MFCGSRLRAVVGGAPSKQVTGYRLQGTGYRVQKGLLGSSAAAQRPIAFLVRRTSKFTARTISRIIHVFSFDLFSVSYAGRIL